MKRSDNERNGQLYYRLISIAHCTLDSDMIERVINSSKIVVRYLLQTASGATTEETARAAPVTPPCVAMIEEGGFRMRGVSGGSKRTVSSRGNSLFIQGNRSVLLEV